jgi:hypothetical protein
MSEDGERVAIAASKAPWFRFLADALPAELWPVVTVVDEYIADLCLACRLGTISNARCTASMARACITRNGWVCDSCLEDCTSCHQALCRDCVSMTSGQECEKCHLCHRKQTVRCQDCWSRWCIPCISFCDMCDSFICTRCLYRHTNDCRWRQRRRPEGYDHIAGDDPASAEDEPAGANDEPALTDDEEALPSESHLQQSVPVHVQQAQANRTRMYTRDRRTPLLL